MKLKLLYALALYIPSAVLPHHAFTETHIAYAFSGHQPGQPAPAACYEQGTELIHQLNRFPHPFDWTYVVVCDDSEWVKIMKTSWQTDVLFIHGSTNQTNSTTFVRGTTLLGMSKSVTAEHVVAHELSHIFLHSPDEVKVERQAQTWLRERSSITVASR